MALKGKGHGPEAIAVLGRAVRTPRGTAGLVIAGLVILVAVIGPAVAPYSTTEFVTAPFARASSPAWLGGDVLGRDVLSRTLDGGWELLAMAAVATALGVIVGAVLGVMAAYYGGLWDSVIMRAVDVILAFPQLVFALLLVSILGPKIWLIVLAVAISHAPQVARVARAAALDISERDFVKAMQILGIPGRRIIRRDVLPNLTSVLMVEIGLRLTYSMLVIAGLSFLGFGLQPPAASWGLMINENRVGLIANPWGVLMPSILIALFTIGVNTFTDSVARASLEHELQKLRGRTVAYVPQDPGSALNPVLKVGTQLREVFAVHGGNADRLTQVMAEAGLENPGPILASYPHQLSGGQQQRVALAMAFACRPRLIVLDEPTTGLDVTTQRRVLDTVRGLCRTYQVAAVYISHDLAVVAEIADHVAVLYSGRLIEIGAASELFSHPAHPYTRGLMRAVPSMESSHGLLGMAGSPPRPGNRPAGCSFRPRCEFAIAECELREPAPVVVSHTGHAARCVRATEVIALSGTALLARDRTVPPAAEPVLTISRVSVSYTNKPVLRDVDLDVGARKSVAIVGTSGSGKTTLARCVVGLHKDWTGTITFAGTQLPPGVRGRTQDQLRKIQFVAQNPYSSLNPRQTIGQIIGNPLTHFSKLPARERDKRIGDALTSVALRESFAARYPDELSGGERQRVALARALVVDPELLVCDEITSALDVSVQAAIVELLLRLQAERGLSLLFITHNLPLVRSIADDVTVISAGQVCEHGSVTQVLTAPKEAYTRQLIADVPGFEHAG